MSLIQDALKRKVEEQHTPPPQHTTPPVPPESASELPPPHSSERKLFFILVIVFILILLVIGISVYFVLNAPKPEPVDNPVIEPALPTAILEAIKPIEPAPAPVPIKSEKIKDKWPNLNFSGSASAGNQRLAIINGRMLSVGNGIQGVTVLEIGKNQVLVEYKGQKRVLSVQDE